MKRASLLIALVTLSCAPSGESVVVVRVRTDEVLPPLSTLLYQVENGSVTDMNELSSDGGLELPTTFALLVPRERAGDLEIRVVGLGADNAPVAFGGTSVTLQRGKRVDAIVLLRTESSGGDGGTEPADRGVPSDAATGPDLHASDSPRDGGAPDQPLEMPDSASGPPPDAAVIDGRPPLSRSLGDPCTASGDCLSGVCADKVCCERACDTECMACNNPGMPGLCTPVPLGPDPHGRCRKDEAPCGRDGLCDGAGQCSRPSPGSSCSLPRCTDGSLTPAGSCDQAGACNTPATMACSNGCSVDGRACAPPPAKLADGESCTAGSQCLSNACVDGVCCATACAACHACNLPGSRGICKPIPDGQDPGGHCTEDIAQPCGLDGFCNGVGGCRLRQSGIVCMVASCSGASKTSASVCDGMGNCQPGSTSSCLPGTCNAAGTDCDITCANNPGGCPAGQICSSLCGVPSICCRQ